MDHIVGELRKHLEKLGIADRTLVMFSSDNGPETTSVVPMRADYAHDGAGPWRGMKRDNWEGGHRVPLIVRWPGHVKSGTISGQLASLTDVMATLAAITGAELPRDAAGDSFNLRPALEGKASAPIRPYLLTQAFGGGPHAFHPAGPWKYIAHRDSGGNSYATPTLKSFALPEAAPGTRNAIWPVIRL